MSSCCRAYIIVDEGHNVCTGCGKMADMVLDTGLCTYADTPKHLIFKPYSRKSRFFKKCLAMLRCMTHYKIDEKLLNFLKCKKITTPEDLFTEISNFPSKKRRPYDSIMFYWVALGNEQPVCLEGDIEKLKHDFDNIFFAWYRLGFTRPRFPYSFLFRNIVKRGGKQYSEGMHQMTRFVRQLSCEYRTARYNDIFEKCAAFDYKMHQPLPKNLPQQTISRERCNQTKSLPVYNRDVYQSYEEVQKAIDSKNFNIAKMFHIDKNGKFYMLSHGDVSLSRMQLQQSQSEQLSQTQKLNQMLRAQSLAP